MPVWPQQPRLGIYLPLLRMAACRPLRWVLPTECQKLPSRGGAIVSGIPRSWLGNWCLVLPGAHILDRSSGNVLEMPGMWVASPISYCPTAWSSAISRATVLRPGAGLDILTIARSPDKESDRMRAKKEVPGSQIRHAMSSANASHRVLKADSPAFAWNRRKSPLCNAVANQAAGRQLR